MSMNFGIRILLGVVILGGVPATVLACDDPVTSMISRIYPEGEKTASAALVVQSINEGRVVTYTISKKGGVSVSDDLMDDVAAAYE